MKTTIQVLVLVTAAAGAAWAAPQMQHDKAAMNHRGHQAMGWDQSKAAHTFADAVDGGSIEVAADDPDDAATIAAIRKHLQEIAVAFKAGEFTKPLFIHGEMPPGTGEMTRLKEAITYRFEERPRGGRVVISSADRDAVYAIHEFLKFQRDEHGTR